GGEPRLSCQRVSMLELPSIFPEYFFEAIIAVVFLYSLITLLVTTSLLITRILQARFRLREVVRHDQLLAVFAQTGLKHLGPRIVHPELSEVPTGTTVRIRGPFRFRRARREVGHL